MFDTVPGRVMNERFNDDLNSVVVTESLGEYGFRDGLRSSITHLNLLEL